MIRLAAAAIITMLVVTPAMADSDKHRRYDTYYTYGSIVSQCQLRANHMRLVGHERRDFVDWCRDRGSRYLGRDWNRRDWDRMYYARDRYRDWYRSDYRYRDDWDDDWHERNLVRILTRDPYFLTRDPYFRYRDGSDDWRYAALQDFIVWSLRD